MGRKTAQLEKDDDTNRYLAELKARLNNNESLLADYEEVILEIELLDEAKVNRKENDDFEKLYYRCIASARQYLEDNVQQVGLANMSIQQPQQFVAIKLPCLGLIKFNGDFSKFQQFFETFQTLIHNNSNLDNIQRFYYLLDSLEGEAKKVLECLEITNDNYLVALDLLKKRFSNKPLIIQAHLKALFDMPILGKESHQLLQGLVDTIGKHIRALKTLGEPVEKWDRLIIFFLGRKLDMESRKEWEEKSISIFNGEPNLENFVEFLENKARVLSTVDYGSKSFKNVTKTSNVRSSFAAVDKGNSSSIKCEYCKGAHFVYFCEKLLSFPVEQRSAEIKKMRLCFNCLRSSHQVKECKSNGCRKCNGRHNTILHPANTNSSTSRNNNGTFTCLEESTDETHEENPVVATACNSRNKVSNQIILSTAIVEINDAKNNFISCRALLDSGSQVNFITKNLAKQLGFKGNKVNVPISGINEMLAKIDSRINSTIKSVHNNYLADLSFLVLENITANIPSSSFDVSSLDIPVNLRLVDPDFHKSDRIDVLLGASIFFDLMCAGQIRLGKNKPILQKTVLGWVVSGRLCTNMSKIDHTNKSFCHFAMQNIHDQLERFWSVEEFPIKKIYSKEEIECEQHFSDTVHREETGRFCVGLPVKQNVHDLGDSLEQATNRLLSLEKKFVRNPMLKQKYCDFIEEYNELGHMTKIPKCELDTEGKVFYLPHHAVLNDASKTTKLRVVFYASAKSSSGLSLNDVLKVGPTIQDELFEILIRFRQYEVVITADIAKMYRQVNILPEQRDLQRIVWRSDSNGEIEHYRLNTITYGTASASFLATRCLQEVANNIREHFPRQSRVMSKCFYVDDLILVIPTIEEAIELGQTVSKILNEYGFPLRKWCSNKTEVLEALSSESNNTNNYIISDNDSQKTLGIFWKAMEDSLEYTIKMRKSTHASVTKCFILSVISQIFDPLGLVGPVTIVAKIILQKLWQLQSGWDESIPLDLFTLWNNFYSQLESLAYIKIPRQCILVQVVLTEIHGFCDASEKAYGACLYLRSINAQGVIQVNLLCAKSRVAPLKYTSLPRLELCGALLLARLANKISNTLDVTIDKTFFWTDSTIVLSWLAEESNNWKVYVANRIAEIQNISKAEQWNHVSSSDNPADIISRGMNPNQLKGSALWWYGPVWLCKNQEYWPDLQTEIPENVIEKRKKKVVLLTMVPDKGIFNLKTSLFQLIKLIAWCLRFFSNLKSTPCNRNHNKDLTTNEIDAALIRLVQIAQEQEFGSDLISLKEKGCVSKGSKLKSLDPFYENGLILVGGRLKRAKEPYSSKHPIILPQKHPLTRLIIADQHKKQLHAGPLSILAMLRNRFWIINGRREVRGVLAKCRTCFRVNPTTLKQKMGNLPVDRIVPQRPFYVCGVDYAGPFNVKDGKLRNRALVKGYMCLFVCFVTKAVHIELVGDLTTHAFLNCLKRFVSRRGLCKRIYSDNATNFVGASNELGKASELLAKIQEDSACRNYLLQNNIDWQFIPARSPHQGGLWESAIKSAKYHVTRIIGNRNFTFEDLSTIFSQVEAVLNSRPLTPLSSDPNDLQALTPGHFLVGDALMALPQKDVVEIPSNRLNQYHLLQQIIQHLWKRWSSEYLTTLQNRSKWHLSYKNLDLGVMVILKDESNSPLNWKLGRVVAVHPGDDGNVRVASILTSSGIVKRAVQKLCVLPVDDLS